MVLEVKIDHLRAEKIKVKHQSVFFGTPCRFDELGIHFKIPQIVATELHLF